MPRTHTIVTVKNIVVVVLVAVMAVTAACTSERRSEPDTDGPPAGDPTSFDTLVYVRNRTLLGYDLDDGERVFEVTLPSADVATTPDGTSYAVVRDLAPGTDPEGFGRPQVLIGTMGEEPTVELGPGRSPLWSPGGTELAVIAPDAEEGERVVVYRSTGEELVSSPHDGAWSLVGWRPGEVVAIGADAGPVIVSARGGAVRGLDVSPISLWGASPTEATYMTVGDRGVAFEGRVRAEVPGISGALGDGAWSWTGRHVVAVELHGARSSLVLIDVDSGRSIEVPGGRGAQGNVVWAEDGKTFAYVRVDPDDRARLQAVVCSAALDCKAQFTWAEGIRLLGFASGPS